MGPKGASYKQLRLSKEKLERIRHMLKFSEAVEDLNNQSFDDSQLKLPEIVKSRAN